MHAWPNKGGNKGNYFFHKSLDSHLTYEYSNFKNFWNHSGLSFSFQNCVECAHFLKFFFNLRFLWFSLNVHWFIWGCIEKKHPLIAKCELTFIPHCTGTLFFSLVSRILLLFSRRECIRTAEPVFESAFGPWPLVMRLTFIDIY